MGCARKFLKRLRRYLHIILIKILSDSIIQKCKAQNRHDFFKKENVE